MNNRTATVTLKLLPSADFASFGQSVIAYVKKVDLDGATAYAVYGADGATLGIEASEQMAMLAARQLNLIPVTLQ